MADDAKKIREERLQRQDTMSLAPSRETSGPTPGIQTAADEIFAKAFHLGPTLMFISRFENGNLVEVNNACCELTGYAREELIGHSGVEMNILSADMRAEIAGRLDREGRLRNFEVPITTKSGDKKTCLISAEKVVFQKEVYLLCSGVDISEHKRAEQALEKRLIAMTRPLDQNETIKIEDLFNIDELQNMQDQFSEAFHVASLITHPDGRPLTRPSNFTDLCANIIRQTEIGRKRCHASDASLGRYHPQGPIVMPCSGCGLWDAGASIAVGGRHVASWLIGQVRDEAQTEEAMRAYARDIDADEEALIEAFRRVPAMRREDFNRIANLLFTLANKLSDMAYQNVQQARFITERRQAEKAVRRSELRYRSLFQSMEAFALMEPVWDNEGRPVDFRYLEVNETGARIRGTTTEAIHGRTILEILPKIDPFWIRAYAQVVMTGQPMQFERRNKQNGRWYRTYAYCPERGKVASLLLDITDRIQAEQSLQEFTKDLERLVAERTALAESRAKELQALAVELIEAEERERRNIADVLHEDLQQLLAAARFTLQSKHRLDPDTREVQRLLEEAIRKSRHLSHELSPPVLLHSGLRASLEWLCLQLREQFGLNVRLQVTISPHVESDPLRIFLFRATRELLFNIVKHAGTETADVQVAGSDDEVIVTVTDSGKGFDPSILDTYTPKAGLGLISLRERASYIGGALTTESAPGQGSRFTLRVPTKMKVDICQPVPAAVEEKPHIPLSTSVKADRRSIRVLFADDHKVMRQGLIRLVSGKPNISVVGEAADGREALELAHRLRPDVVVMDVSMPGMDGVEATRRIRAELTDVRVIGLSMHEDEHVSEAMRNAGAEAFLSKATSSKELLKAIYDAVPAGTPARTEKDMDATPIQLELPMH